jgi:hypothetical protein
MNKPNKNLRTFRENKNLTFRENKNLRTFKGRKEYTIAYKDEVAQMVITGGMSEYDVSVKENVPLAYVERWVANAKAEDENNNRFVERWVANAKAEDENNNRFIEVGRENIKEVICLLIDTLLEPKKGTSPSKISSKSPSKISKPNKSRNGKK